MGGGKPPATRYIGRFMEVPAIYGWKIFMGEMQHKDQTGILCIAKYCFCVDKKR